MRSLLHESGILGGLFSDGKAWAGRLLAAIASMALLPTFRQISH